MNGTITDSNAATRIFFTDLDGTLLTKEKNITPATMNALRKWSEAGHKFAVCTGRAMDSAKDVKRTLGLDFPGTYLIGYNGGEIYDCDNATVISRTPLTMEQAALVARVAREHGIHCQTYTDHNIISPADDEELHFYQRAIHTPAIISKNVTDALDKPPCKLVAIELHDKEKIEDFRQALQPMVDGELNLIYSNDRYLEIFPAQSGKGAAVEILCRHLGIPVAASLAAGDEANDISMIETAGIGIAMSNARESVKAVADIITETDNDHDGLAPVLLANL